MILPFIFIFFAAVAAGHYAHSFWLGAAVYLGLCAIVGTLLTIARNPRR